MNSTSTTKSLCKRILSVIAFICYFIYAGSLKAHPTTYASLGDFVWVDVNGNGIQDSGEPGVANVTVKLLNSTGGVVATTTTNSAGKYLFTNVYVPSCTQFRVQFGTPGQYTWTTKMAPGSTVTNNSNADVNGLSDAFTLCAGDNNLCLDAGIRLAGIFNPDINVTFVNVQIPGDVSTNDKVPAGTTYGTTPTLLSKPAGSTATITMNSNGTYTFIANTVGVYIYNVPVCVPGQSAPCPPSLLTITVLGPNANNPPVANTDFATTKVNTPVTLNSLANDRAGNPGGTLNPASVTVTTAPLHGTATVNTSTGAITYTPASGYTGMDTLTYRVCDNGSPSLCATAKQIIRIVPANATNTTTAADDYATTSINTPVSGNVKTNDSDPEGNTQTVTTQTTTVTGKGTLVLNADGTFTFTPATGFTGPVSFVYTTCDNGVPQACANATLYITVFAVPDLTPRINLNPNNIIGQSNMEITVQVNEINNIPTNGSTITLYVDKQNLFSNFTFNSAQTTNAAGQPVQNSLFTIDAVSNPDFYVITTNAVFANSLRRVTFSVTVKPGQTKGSTPVNVYLKDGSGGETNFTNNSNFTILTFSF